MSGQLFTHPSSLRRATKVQVYGDGDISGRGQVGAVSVLTNLSIDLDNWRLAKERSPRFEVLHHRRIGPCSLIII